MFFQVNKTETCVENFLGGIYDKHESFKTFLIAVFPLGFYFSWICVQKSCVISSFHIYMIIFVKFVVLREL